MSIQSIIDLWSPLYTITARDITFLSKPVRGQFTLFNYGTYCGPFTPPQYALAYEEQQPLGDPIDALDFICYLHDKFYQDPRSDEFMLQSISILNSANLIGLNITGVKNLLQIIRKFFNAWRWITGGINVGG